MISSKTIQKTIDLVEYDEMFVSREELSFLGEEGFEEIQKQISPLVTISPTWTGKSFRIKADSKVGVITVQGLRVQVQPKLSAGEFCTLIRYVLSGKIPPEHFRSLSDLTWATGFEDALCTLLSDEVTEILRIGVSRRYEERVEPLDVLRGRPVWEKNFPWLGGKAREIVCRYHRLTYDNIDNRLLLSGLRKASLLSSNIAVKTRVLQHLNKFITLAADTAPDVSQFEEAEQGYSRLNEHYRIAHGLSKMFIYGLRSESFFKEGKYAVSGVVLNMAFLFEKFVEKFIGEMLIPAGFTLKPQTRDHRALLDHEGQLYASVRPDLEVWRGEHAIGVIDAKYKPYWKADDLSLKPARKISNEDLYQLYFYQQRMQRKYGLYSPPIAAIAAPIPADDELGDSRIISKRYRRVFWQAGPEKAGDVRLLLVPMTRFLRSVIDKKYPAEVISKTGFDDIANLFLN